MTWFLVIIGEIILILFGVVIVLLSTELPQPPKKSVVKSQQKELPQSLDKPADIHDNDYIDDDEWE